MGYDLNGYIIDEEQRLGHSGLSVVGSTSKAFSEEQDQLRSQLGPKKRTYIVYDIGGLGYKLGVATKRIGDRIVAQILALLGPNGEMMLYQFLNSSRSGKLIGGAVARNIPPEEAVNRMLLEAYGLKK
ncbi:hypothetical protein HYX04_05630 [Candidatus Woesearchaeota archaeon]|nr:hypothetical protein [Candidatus Woesearchaeota archaeon]